MNLLIDWQFFLAIIDGYCIFQDIHVRVADKVYRRSTTEKATWLSERDSLNTFSDTRDKVNVRALHRTEIHIRAIFTTTISAALSETAVVRIVNTELCRSRELSQQYGKPN